VQARGGGPSRIAAKAYAVAVDNPYDPAGVTYTVVTDAAPVGIRRSKTPIILAAAVAVALVASVGAFVAYRLVFGGPQPAERVPASVIAYFSLDLSPGLDQNRKLAKLSEKLPQTGREKDPKAALEKALKELDLEGVDVARDISAWLGTRLGAGAWANGGHEMFGLLALQSTDDKAAQAGLARIKTATKGRVGFTVHDGFALVAFGDKDGQAAADAAAAEAVTSPLSKSAKYTEARKWLDSDQLAVFFADYDAFRKIVESMDTMGTMTLTGQMPTGTMILGVKAEDDGLSARFRSFGGKAKPAAPATDAMGKLGALPAGTGVGVVARLDESTTLFPFLMLGMPFGFMTAGGQPDEIDPPSPLTPQEEQELDALIAKQAKGSLTKAEQKRLDELSAKMMGPMKPPRELTPAERKELDALLAKGRLTEAEKKRLAELMGVPDFGSGGPNGLDEKSWEDMFGALSGGLLTLTATDFATKPAFRAIVELAKAPDAATAKRLTELSDKDVTVSLDGTTLSVQSKGFAGTGRLGDDPLFRRATAAAPAGDAQLAVYADLTRIVPADARAQFGPFQAIFVVSTNDSGMVRVLIG
jgi:hypothetical protein